MEKANRRYARQIAVPEIGREGQQKLIEAKVLVVGCGALGSMVAMQLAGAGIGTIGIADFDNVDISNLQRQFFFTDSEAGLPKVELLAKKISALNPEIQVNIISGFLTPKKGLEIFPDYDFIVDATDNPESKTMIGETSLKMGKGCCIGGVKDFSGQVMTVLPGTPAFEEFFGYSTSDGVLPCSLGGVMGPAAALCASIQASETIKFLVNPDFIDNSIITFNLLTNSFRKFVI